MIKDTPFYLGNAMVNKTTNKIIEPKPIVDAAYDDYSTDSGDIEQQTKEDKHITMMPHDHGGTGLRKDSDGMHAHFGHPDPHPIRLRHRKTSADPLHKEEDSLMDEWGDLYDKAVRGECTPQEIERINQIKGRVGEINSSRSSDAERILGIAAAYLHKSEDSLEPFQVEESDLKDNDESWRGREREYGDEDDLTIIPTNDGYKDEVDRSESIGGTVPTDKRVAVFEPDEVEDGPVTTKKAPEPTLDGKAITKSLYDPNTYKPVEREDDGDADNAEISQLETMTAKALSLCDSIILNSVLSKAAQLTEDAQAFLAKEWGSLQVKGDDGRFSDPLFISKYIESATAKAMSKLSKHDLPGSPHSEHMTNGGGWQVKLNPKTGNFVAYQTPDGNMQKRTAQLDANRRNGKNKKETEENDKLTNGGLDSLNPNPKPLNKEPRMQVGRPAPMKRI